MAESSRAGASPPVSPRSARYSNSSSRTGGGTPSSRRPGWHPSSSRHSSNNGLPKDVRQMLQPNKSATGLSQVSSGRTSATEMGTLEQILDIKRLIEEKERQIREAAAPQAEEQYSYSEETEEKLEKQLNECVAEFLATESNYLEDLRFTTREYSQPLAEIIPHQTHYKIFSNHEQLLELHVRLDQALQKAKKETGIARHEALVSSFLGLLPYFKMYAAYCSNYPHVASSLSSVRQEPKVNALMNRKHTEHQTTLQALLFRPVQRMCLYPLIFKRMVNTTAEGLPLHKLCLKAFEGMESLNCEVNENVRNMESRLHMMEVLTKEVKSNDIQLLFENPRSLLREVLVDMKCHGASIARPDWRIRRQYKWFIFSDYLLVCRPDMLSSGWHKKELWPLSSVAITTTNPSARITSGSASGANLSFGSGGVIAGRLPSWQSRDEVNAPLPRANQQSQASSEGLGGEMTETRSNEFSNNSDHGASAKASSSSKSEKAEVFHITCEKANYKCWAQSEEEMIDVVRTVSRLKSVLEGRQEDIRRRAQAS